MKFRAMVNSGRVKENKKTKKEFKKKLEFKMNK
jgi:hypothetical protein